MIKKITLVCLFTCSFFYGQAQNQWKQLTSNTGHYRDRGISFVIENKAYVGLGRSSSSTYLNDLWEFDPTTAAWTQKANFPSTGRDHPAAFAIGEKAYVGTGYDGTPKKDFYSYSPKTNTWSTIQDMPGQARYDAGAFAIGDKGYCGAGTAGGPPYLKDFYEYNPLTDTWTSKADFVTNRCMPLSAAIGDKGYFGLGDTYSGIPTDDLYEYDPQNDSWTAKASLPGGARIGATPFVVFNKLYVIEGQSGVPSTYSDFWEFDPKTNKWTQKTNRGNTPRHSSVGFSIFNKGYISGGLESTWYDDLWEFSTYFDSIPPILTLIGNAKDTVDKGSTYTDLGVTADDNHDGIITSKVVKTGNVNTNIEGNYILYYNVSDSAGNVAITIEREVYVKGTSGINSLGINSFNIFSTHKTIKINSGSVNLEGINMELFDLTGKLVQSQKVNSRDINLGFLNDGIYICRISNDKGHYKSVKVLLND